MRDAVSRGDADVDATLAFLETTHAPPPRAPSADKEAYRERMSVIEVQARAYGLAPGHVSAVVALATRGGLHDSLAKRLFKALVPRTTVPESCVVTAIARFNMRLDTTGECVISLGIRGYFLRWLLAVFELLDSRVSLHRLYGVLFRLLWFDSLRADACHLLYLLTRPSDVQHFRIQRLLELESQVGSEAPLVALLGAYRALSPSSDIHVADNAPQSFRPPSAKLQEVIRAVHERMAAAAVPARHPGSQQPGSLHAVAAADGGASSVWSSSSTEVVAARSRKRLRVDPVIPPPRSGMSVVAGIDTSTGLSSFESIASLQDLCAKIDSLELPSQAAAVLGSHAVQHVVACSPSARASICTRLAAWLQATLASELVPGRGGSVTVVAASRVEASSRSRRLLGALVDLVDFMHDAPPVLGAFLGTYLPTWNGIDHADLVLRLVSRTRPCAYEELYAGILRPINALFFTSPPQTKVRILLCYRDMVARFALTLRRAGLVSGGVTGRGRDAEGGQAGAFVFGPLAANVDHHRTLYEFVRHVDSMAVLGMECESDHAALHDAALAFYETVVEFNLHYGLPFLMVPSEGIVYRCFFASNAMAVSRIAGLIARYKTAFDALKEKQVQSRGSGGQLPRLTIPTGLERLDLFNGYIMEFCNVLWRNRVLPEDGSDVSNCFDLPRESKLQLRASLPGMNNLFSVTQSPVFCSMTRQYLIECQQQVAASEGRDVDLAGIRPSVIKDRFRVPFLDFLRSRNVVGVYEFLYTFIHSLVQRRVKGLERRVADDAFAM
eukprot:Opistho-2@94195